MTYPKVLGPYCQNCGQYGHTACTGIPIGNHSALPGWICPVCGTGVAPWKATHCDKPQPMTVSAEMTADL